MLNIAILHIEVEVDGIVPHGVFATVVVHFCLQLVLLLVPNLNLAIWVHRAQKFNIVQLPSIVKFEQEVPLHRT